MWVILALIVIIIVGIIWYLQQQKEEEETEAVVIMETSPTQTGSLVNTMPSQFRVHPSHTGYRLQTVTLVPEGQAKGQEDCRTAAERAGVKSWVYDRSSKKCWAYVDNTMLQKWATSTSYGHPSYTKRSVTGCTQPGVMVTEGCEDWTIGDRVRGSSAASVKELTPVQTYISLDECIAKGKANNVDAIRYYSNYSKADTQGKCYEINDADSLTGWTGNPRETRYVEACTDPSKKVINGCR